MARRKRSAVDKALFHMRPNRVLARYLSGGKHQTFKSIAKSPFKTKTVHTPKSGRRAYQQLMARERKERAQRAAKERKQVAAFQKAQRAEQRKQQPRTYRTAPGPIAVNPRTGRPITYAQARAGMNQAQREVDRILAGLEGRAPAARRPRRQTEPAPLPPLQAAIKEVKAKRARKTAAKKTTAKKPPVGAKPARTGAKPKPRKRAPAEQSKTIADTVAVLIPARAILAPTAPGRTTPGAPVLQPLPVRTRASRNARRGLYGAVLKKTCECAGTGRIPVYDEKGYPHGSASCPVHGRGGTRRGQKRLTAKRAIRDSGLPGLSAWLIKRREKKRGNSDKRQAAAFDRARRYPRLAGPTVECEWCEGGIVERRLTERLRKQHMDDARTEAARLVCAAEAHNARVQETGDGDLMKVSKMPPEKQLEKAARLAFPHDLCSKCGGLGVRETSVRLMQDGQQPVAEWRTGAGLNRGHRSTGRERTTGRRPTKNAVRVERRRRLPRI